MLPTRRPLSDPSRGLSGSRSLPGLRHRGKPSSRAERWVLPDAPPPVSPSSSLPSLEEARSPAHDEALVGFVREAVGLSAPEALALAVRVAAGILPAAQHAHFLALCEAGDAIPEGEEAGAPADPLARLELRLVCSGSASAPKVSPSDGGAASPHAPAPPRIPGWRLPLHKGLAGWAARSGLPVVEPDGSRHLAFHAAVEAPLVGRSPVLCVPLLERQDGAGAAAVRGAPSVAGVLLLTGRFGARFGAIDLQLATMLLDVVRSRPHAAAHAAAGAPHAAVAALAAARADNEAMAARLSAAEDARAAAEAEAAAARDEVAQLRAEQRAAAAATPETPDGETSSASRLRLWRLEEEAAAVCAREARLIPELERWQGITTQLGDALGRARDFAASAAASLALRAAAAAAPPPPASPSPAALYVTPNEPARSHYGVAASPGGGGGAATEDAAAAEAAEAAARRALRLFEASLDEAVPNLEVAGPWLGELLRPMQTHLKAVAAAVPGIDAPSPPPPATRSPSPPPARSPSPPPPPPPEVRTAASRAAVTVVALRPPPAVAAPAPRVPTKRTARPAADAAAAADPAAATEGAPAAAPAAAAPAAAGPQASVQTLVPGLAPVDTDALHRFLPAASRR